MISRTQIDNILEYLQSNNVLYKRDVSLRDYSYFQTGGQVKLIIYPQKKSELSGLIYFLHAAQCEYKVIGDTSNILFLDDLHYGIFLSLKQLKQIEFDKKEQTIEAQAGAELPELSRKALLFGITGFEGLEGIPGTVGGGVIMNAGAYDSEIKDCLLCVRGVQSNGEVFEFNCEELGFSNRNSFLRDHLGEYIVTSAVFRAEPGDAEKIFAKMELYHAKRHKHQDFLYPTLGSLFSTRDVYSEIGHQDKRFLACLWFFKKFIYSKRFRRETPMNRVHLNRFVCRYFGWNFSVQPFSNKTMNSLTNRGQHTDRFLEYIELLKRHLPDSVRIENEVLNDFLFDDQK